MKGELISSHFTGHHGPASLYNSAVNISLAKEEVRSLISGRHTVRDVHCLRCDNYLGWKYVEAPSGALKYKEGKFILERRCVWDEADEY